MLSGSCHVPRHFSLQRKHLLGGPAADLSHLSAGGAGMGYAQEARGAEAGMLPGEPHRQGGMKGGELVGGSALTPN